MAYKLFNKSKKKEVDDKESTASNTIVIEDWIYEVSSIFAGKIKLRCSSDILILPIEFMKWKTMNESSLPKEKKGYYHKKSSVV